jgi:hypothetical protein
MTDETARRISFTEILYSVVIATALSRLSFGVSLRNAMLLFAILILLSDWVEYIAGIEKTDKSVSGMKIFAADMLVLLVWNTIAIIPSEKFFWYVTFLGVFFMSQQVWELIADRYSSIELLTTPTTGLVVAYVGMAIAVNANLVEDHISLALCVLLFIIAKTPAWLRIQSREEPIQI